MSHVTDPPSPDLDRERDAMIVALVVALIHARRKGDRSEVADICRELARLGVQVRFSPAGGGP